MNIENIISTVTNTIADRAIRNLHGVASTLKEDPSFSDQNDVWSSTRGVDWRETISSVIMEEKHTDLASARRLTERFIPQYLDTVIEQASALYWKAAPSVRYQAPTAEVFYAGPMTEEAHDAMISDDDTPNPTEPTNPAKRWGVVSVACACCGAPLTDATSIERGIGPICSRKYYQRPESVTPDWESAQVHMDRALEQGALTPQIAAELTVLFARRGAQDDRAIANLLVLQASAYPGDEKAIVLAQMIEGLGFVLLSQVLASNCGAIRIETEDDEIRIKHPYSQRFYFGMKDSGVPYRTRSLKGWGRGNKVWCMSVAHRRALWSNLKRAFPGHLLLVNGKIQRVPEKS